MRVDDAKSELKSAVPSLLRMLDEFMNEWSRTDVNEVLAGGAVGHWTCANAHAARGVQGTISHQT